MDIVDPEVLIAAIRLTTQFLQDRNGVGVSTQQIVGLLSLHDSNSLVPSNLRRLLTEANTWSEDASGWKVLQSLFDLFHMCVTCTGHINVLVNAGVYSALLQFLKLQQKSARLSQVCALKCLESITDLAGVAATNLYRDHDGFNAFAERLGIEVDCLLTDPCPPDSGQPTEELWEKLELCTWRRQLCRQLLRNIQVALQCPDVVGRGLNHLLTGPLADVMKKIFEKPSQVGLSVYGVAVNILTHLVGDDPGCVPILIEKGLVPTLLDSIKFENMDNPDVLANIPVALGSISLHNEGDKEVNKRSPHPMKYVLECLIKPEFVPVLSIHGDLPSTFGQQCEEILRNRSAVKPTIYAIVKKTLEELRDQAKTYPVWRISQYKDNELLADRLNSYCCFLESFLVTTDACQWFLKEVFPTFLEICHMKCMPFQFPVIAQGHAVVHVAKLLIQSCPDSVHKPLGDLLQSSLKTLNEQCGLPVQTPPSNAKESTSTDAAEIPQVDNKLVVENAKNNVLQWPEKSAQPTTETEKRNAIFTAISKISTVLHLYYTVYRDINAPLPPATMAALANTLAVIRPYALWIVLQHARVPFKYRDRKSKPNNNYGYFTEFARMQYGGKYDADGQPAPVSEEESAISGYVLRAACQTIRSFVNSTSRAANYASMSRRSSRTSTPTLHVTAGSCVLVLGSLQRDLLSSLAAILPDENKELNKTEAFILASFICETLEIVSKSLLDDRQHMVRVLSVEGFKQVGGFRYLRDAINCILRLPALQEKATNDDKMDVDATDLEGEDESSRYGEDHRGGIAGDTLQSYCLLLERLSSWKRIRDAPCVPQMQKLSMKTTTSSPGLQKLLDGFSTENICAYVHAVVLESLLPVWLAPPSQIKKFPQRAVTATLRGWLHVMEGPHHARPKALKDEAKAAKKTKRDKERKGAKGKGKGKGGKGKGKGKGMLPVFVIDETALQTLTDMGFPQAHARESLEATRSNNLEYAVEWIETNPPGSYYVTLPGGGPPFDVIRPPPGCHPPSDPPSQVQSSGALASSSGAQGSGAASSSATASAEAGGGARPRATSAPAVAEDVTMRDEGAAPPSRDPSPTGPYLDGALDAPKTPPETPRTTTRTTPPSPDEIFLDNALKMATAILKPDDMYSSAADILDQCLPKLLRSLVPRMLLLGSFHSVEAAVNVADIIASFAVTTNAFITPPKIQREVTSSSAASDAPPAHDMTEIGWPIPFSSFLPPDDYVLPESSGETDKKISDDDTATKVIANISNNAERDNLAQALEGVMERGTLGGGDMLDETLIRTLMGVAGGEPVDIGLNPMAARDGALMPPPSRPPGRDRVFSTMSRTSTNSAPDAAGSGQPGSSSDVPSRPSAKNIALENCKWILYCVKVQIQYLRAFFSAAQNKDEAEDKKKQMEMLLQIALRVLAVVSTRSKAAPEAADLLGFVDLLISYLEVLPPQELFVGNATVQSLLSRGYTTVLGSTVFPSDTKDSLVKPPEWLSPMVVATQTLLTRVTITELPENLQNKAIDQKVLQTVHQQRLLEACAKLLYAFPGCGGPTSMAILQVVRTLANSTSNAQFFLSRNCRYSFDKQGFLLDSPVGGLHTVLRTSRHNKFNGHLKIVGDITNLLLEDNAVLAARLEHIVQHAFEGTFRQDPRGKARGPVTEMELSDLLLHCQPTILRNPLAFEEVVQQMTRKVASSSSSTSAKSKTKVTLAPASERVPSTQSSLSRRRSISLEGGSTAGVVAYALVDELMLFTHLQMNMRFYCFQQYDSMLSAQQESVDKYKEKKKKKRLDSIVSEGTDTTSPPTPEKSPAEKDSDPYILPASTGTAGQQLTDYPLTMLPESMLYLLDQILASCPATIAVFMKNLPAIVPPKSTASANVISCPDYLPEGSVWFPASVSPNSKEKTLLAVLLKRVFPLIAGQAELWNHQCRMYANITTKVGFSLTHLLGPNNMVHRQVLRFTQILSMLAKSPEVRKRLMVDCSSLLKQIADQPASLTSGNNSSSALAQALGLCSLLHKLLTTMPASSFKDDKKDNKDGKKDELPAVASTSAISSSAMSSGTGSKEPSAPKMHRSVSAASASAIPGLSKMDLSSLKLSLSRLLHAVQPTRADVTELLTSVLKCLEFLTRPALLPLSGESTTDSSGSGGDKRPDGYVPLGSQSHPPSSDMLSMDMDPGGQLERELVAFMRNAEEEDDEQIEQLEVMDDDDPRFEDAMADDGPPGGGHGIHMPDASDSAESEGEEEIVERLEDDDDDDDDDEDDYDEPDGMGMGMGMDLAVDDEAEDDDIDPGFRLLGFEGSGAPLLSEQGFEAFDGDDGWDNEPLAPFAPPGRGMIARGWGSELPSLDRMFAGRPGGAGSVHMFINASGPGAEDFADMLEGPGMGLSLDSMGEGDSIRIGGMTFPRFDTGPRADRWLATNFGNDDGGGGMRFMRVDQDSMPPWLAPGGPSSQMTPSWPFADIAQLAAREALGQPNSGYVQQGDLDPIADIPNILVNYRSRSSTSDLRGARGGSFDWNSLNPPGLGLGLGEMRFAGGAGSEIGWQPLQRQEFGMGGQENVRDFVDDFADWAMGGRMGGSRETRRMDRQEFGIMPSGGGRGGRGAGREERLEQSVRAFDNLISHLASNLADAPPPPEPTPPSAPAPAAAPEPPSATTSTPADATSTATQPAASTAASQPAAVDPTPSSPPEAVMESGTESALEPAPPPAPSPPPPIQPGQAWTDEQQNQMAMAIAAAASQAMAAAAAATNGATPSPGTIAESTAQSQLAAAVSSVLTMNTGDVGMIPATESLSSAEPASAPADDDVTMDDVQPAASTTEAGSAAPAEAPASSGAAASTPAQDPPQQQPAPVTSEDTPMDDSATGNAEPSAAAPAATSNANAGTASANNNTDSGAAGSSTDVAGEAAPSEPLYDTESLGIESLNATSRRIGVHGAHILNHLGVDPTFLEALPVDMRIEAIGASLVGADFSALRQRYNPTASAEPSASGPQGDASNTEIAGDILAALPPELRAEAQLQMAQQAARENEPIPDPAMAEDMDNASFIATLDAEMRREVLLTAGQDFLSTLPPDLLAEAQLHRDRAMQTSRRTTRTAGATGSGAAPSGGARQDTRRAERRRREVPAAPPADPGGLRGVLQAFDNNTLGVSGRRGAYGRPMRNLFGQSAADIFSQIFDVASSGGSGMDLQISDHPAMGTTNPGQSLSQFVNSTGSGARSSQPGPPGRRGQQDHGGHGQDDSLAILKKAVAHYVAGQAPPLEPAVVPALCRTVFFRNFRPSHILRRLFLNICLHPKTMRVALSNLMVALVWRPSDQSLSPTGLPPLQLFECLEGASAMTPATTAETVAFGSKYILSLFGHLILKWPALSAFFADPLDISAAVPEFATSALATGNGENWTHDFRRKKKKNSSGDNSFQPIGNILAKAGHSQIPEGVTSVDLLISLLKEQLFQTSRTHTVFLVSIIHALLVDPDEEKKERKEAGDGSASASASITPEPSTDGIAASGGAAGSTAPVAATTTTTIAVPAAQTATDGKKDDKEADKTKDDKKDKKKEDADIVVPYDKLRSSLRTDASASLLNFLCNGNVVGSDKPQRRESRRNDDPGGDIMTKIGEILVALARGSGGVNHVGIIRTELAKQTAMLVREIRAEFEPSGEITRWVISPEQRLLRLVKTLQKVCNANPDFVKLTTILQEADVESLWRTLEAALENANDTTAANMDTPAMRILAGEAGGVSSSKGIPPALTKLLPLIEAFFLIYDESDPKDKDKKKPTEQTPSTPARESSTSDPTRPPEGKVASFCEKHKRVINMFVKQTPTLLSRGFAPMVKASPHMLDFDNKRHYFRSKLKGHRGEHRYDTVRLRVRRSEVFMDSYHQLRMRSGDEMKGRTQVTFIGEEGVDAGGLVREWFDILARDMLNPNYALFSHVGGKACVFHPNETSYYNNDHLIFFEFVGKIVAKAIYEQQNLSAYFSRAFYKHILGKPVNEQDMESFDPDFYKSGVEWILNNDITGILENTFSAESDEFGRTRIVDLKPNGRNIPVTQDNKHEYVRLMCAHKLTHSVHKQIDAFKKGFYDIIPFQYISMFDDRELELLISGLPEIDIADMKANTEYVNFTESSPQIKWFWKTLQNDFTQEDVAWFMQFVTGTSRIPLEGFKGLIGMRGPQKFSIHRAYGHDRLPTAHTCFNQLDLPDYPDEETLKKKLIQAVREAHEGFGFV